VVAARHRDSVAMALTYDPERIGRQKRRSYWIATEALLRAGSPEPLIPKNGRHTWKSQVVSPHIGQRGGSLDAAAP
jgi:hypothetical protein